MDTHKAMYMAFNYTENVGLSLVITQVNDSFAGRRSLVDCDGVGTGVPESARWVGGRRVGYVLRQ